MAFTNIFVPVSEIKSFRKKVAKFNKKASNAGANPLNIVEVTQETKTDDSYMVKGFNVTLSSETFKIGNYTTNAIITRDDLDVITVTSLNNSEFNAITNDDVDFRQCDHCGVRHARKTVIKLESENDEIQVGKSCVKEFLGVSVSTFDWITKEFKEILESEYDFAAYGMSYYNVIDVLAATNVAYKRYGYVKTSNTDYDTAPTKLVVGEYLETRIDEISKEDYTWAEKAVETLKSMLPTNDYQQNIKNIVDADYCSTKNLGILCSSIVMIKRDEEKKEEQSKAKEVSEHVGNVKERITFKGTILHKFMGDGFYGANATYIIKDEEGNQFKWKATSSNHFRYEVGSTMQFTGTVKSHEVYRDIKQTHLQRCKTVEV